jgi:hypothetical protein
VLDVFLARFAAAHGDRYDYSRVVYRGALEKVEIICRDHGPFWQIATNHAKGVGCPTCAKDVRVATRRKTHPPLPDDERARRRKEVTRRYESKLEVKKRRAEKRQERRESGEAQRYAKEWYERNKESVLARVAQWGANNPEKVAAAKSRYRLTVWDSEHVQSRLRVATPEWVDMSAIKEIYEECRRITEETGVLHHVDHIEPLRGTDRCGLHVANNLRIVPAIDNLKKGNSGVAPKRKEFLMALTDQERSAYVETLFAECRAAGFPYFDCPNSDTVIKSIVTARNYLGKQPIESELFATAHGNVVASAFFPHMFQVRMGDKVSPEDVFFSDTLLKRALTKAVQRHDHISDRVIRTAVSLYGGARAVSNFPPMVAAKLYRRFAGDAAVVYDPCGGWGGRMLGAAIAPNVSSYVCTEVSTLTVEGLQQLSECVSPYLSSTVIHAPTEDFVVEGGIDMVMTSPPYFDHEKYSSDANQSYLRYKTPDAWVDGFLTKLIQNAFRMLRNQGTLVLNIANVPTMPNLTAETMRVALGTGFRHDMTLPLYIRSTDGETRKKYEPVFVFRKP